MMSFRPDGRPEANATLRILANLVPLIGVVAFGWQAFDLLELYWLEIVMIALVYSVVFSCQFPKRDVSDRTSLLVQGVALLVSTGTLGMILLMERAVLLGFVDGPSAQGILASIRRLGPAVLALVLSYLVWVLSIYLPEYTFTDEGVSTVSNRLFRELVILHVLAFLVSFIAPVFDSATPVLVVLVFVKLHADLNFDDSGQLFGAEPDRDNPTDSAD